LRVATTSSIAIQLKCGNQKTRVNFSFFSWFPGFLIYL
jgi:hypothetical protein